MSQLLKTNWSLNKTFTTQIKIGFLNNSPTSISIEKRKLILISSKNSRIALLFIAVLCTAFSFGQTTLTSRKTGNWNTNDTWLSNTLTTGTITTTTSSVTVTGIGTNFTGQLSVGAALYKTNGTLIGTVSSITSNTSLILTGNAANANTGINFRFGKIPGALDDVILSNNGFDVTILSGIVATCASLEIGVSGTNSSEFLSFTDSTSSLSVSGNVTIFGPTTGNTREIKLNAGTLTVGGNLSLGTGQIGSQNNRITLITISSGTATVVGNLTFNNVNGSDPLQTQINMTGGSGTFNLGGAFTINNNSGTLLPGTSSTFNFNGSVSQTVPIGVSNVDYNNLNINNTNSSGATISAIISATNVTGNINIQTGTLNNGGFAIAGNATKAISVSNGAVLNLSSTSTFPSGFGTTTLGASSTINYNGTTQAVPVKSYGNLTLSNSGNKTFAGATTIAGNLTLSGTAVALLLNGSTSSAVTLSFGDVYQNSGSWGGTNSSATNKTASRFGTTTTGILNNSNSCTAATIAGGGTTVCPEAATTLTLSGNTGAIQWQSSSDNSTFSNIIGEVNSTYTAANLVATTYFRTTATNGVCSAANSPSVILSVRNTTFNGTTWSNGNPDASTTIAYNFSGNYTLNSDISACSCTVSNGNLTIASGNTMTLLDKLTVSSGSVTFENNASLIQTNSVSNSGSITVKRNSGLQVRLDHTLWAAPVADANLFGFSPLTLTNRFFTYDTASNTYINSGLSGSSTFTVGKGFAVRAPNTFTTTPQTWEGTFSGIPNNGTIPFAIETTGTGYNLVGNPYPSPIDATRFVSGNSNISGSLYFYAHTLTIGTNGLFPSGTNYAVWNGSGSTAATTGTSGVPSLLPNGTIQVGQGFIVKATGSGNVNFTNSMRIANTNNQFFRNATTIERHRLWLNLSNDSGTNFNQILVGYIEGATMGFDSNFDGLAFGNTGSYLSSKIDGADYAIQGRALAFSENDVVQLGFNAENAGNYTITLAAMDGLFIGNQAIYLHDTFDNSIHELKTAAYTFYSETGTFNSRFQLVFTTTLGITTETFNSNSVIAIRKEGVFNVYSEKNAIKEVLGFDNLGRFIYKQSDINSKTAFLSSLPKTNGIVFLKVISQENKTFTIKINNY